MLVEKEEWGIQGSGAFEGPAGVKPGWMARVAQSGWRALLMVHHLGALVMAIVRAVRMKEKTGDGSLGSMWMGHAGVAFLFACALAVQIGLGYRRGSGWWFAFASVASGGGTVESKQSLAGVGDVGLEQAAAEEEAVLAAAFNDESRERFHRALVLWMLCACLTSLVAGPVAMACSRDAPPGSLCCIGPSLLGAEGGNIRASVWASLVWGAQVGSALWVIGMAQAALCPTLLLLGGHFGRLLRRARMGFFSPVEISEAHRLTHLRVQLVSALAHEYVLGLFATATPALVLLFATSLGESMPSPSAHVLTTLVMGVLMVVLAFPVVASAVLAANVHVASTTELLVHLADRRVFTVDDRDELQFALSTIQRRSSGLRFGPFLLDFRLIAKVVSVGVTIFLVLRVLRPGSQSP